MDDWEFNTTMSAYQIANLVLSGKLGDEVCERVLAELNINDDEAGCLEQNIEAFIEGEE
jgi:hypothetical protein